MSFQIKKRFVQILKLNVIAIVFCVCIDCLIAVFNGAMLSEKFAVNEGDEADKFPGTADALVLCYPVISLTSSFAHGNSGKNLFGPETPDEVKAQLNMNELVDASTPPSFLWHTADDDAVSVYNSLEFAQKMWQCGNSCELHVFPHGYHGRGLGYGTADLKQWTDLCAVFWRQVPDLSGDRWNKEVKNG
jgi:acetyl esterase/lipase